MPKVKISEYSATANSNTDVASINIDEGCAPSGINNAIRAVMGHLKDFQQGTNGDPFNGPVNGTLGATTASTANVTTLTTSSTVTHNGGTANGVAYLNGSKVLTTGSALVFDGTNLGVGVTPNAWTPTYRKALQLNTYSAISGDSFFGLTDISTNAYESATGTFSYITSAPAADYRQDNNGKHIWYQAASGTAGNAITFTQAMTLDAIGRLLVGTTNAGSNQGMTIYNATQGELRLQNSTTGNTAADGFQLMVNGSDAYVFNRENAPLLFGTNDTERARFTSSGYFKASNTGTYQNSSGTYHELRNDANTNTARITNTIASGYTDAIVQVSFAAYAPNTTNSWFLFCDDSTTNRVQLRSNGGIANYSANDVNLSDRREKTNFAPASSYLDKICAIPVQTFNYIDQNMEDDGGLTLGVVAQDVQAIAPELVMESDWAKEGDEPKMRLSIYQTDLQYALMKALQELKAEFDAYKASHP